MAELARISRDALEEPPVHDRPHRDVLRDFDTDEVRRLVRGAPGLLGQRVGGGVSDQGRRTPGPLLEERADRDLLPVGHARIKRGDAAIRVPHPGQRQPDADQATQSRGPVPHDRLHRPAERRQQRRLSPGGVQRRAGLAEHLALEIEDQEPRGGVEEAEAQDGAVPAVDGETSLRTALRSFRLDGLGQHFAPDQVARDPGDGRGGEARVARQFAARAGPPRPELRQDLDPVPRGPSVSLFHEQLI